MKNTRHLISDLAQSRSLLPRGTLPPSTSPKAHTESKRQSNLFLYHWAVVSSLPLSLRDKALSYMNYILSIILSCHSQLAESLCTGNKSLRVDCRERYKACNNMLVNLQSMEKAPLILSTLTLFLAHSSGTWGKKFCTIYVKFHTNISRWQMINDPGHRI